MSLRFSRQIATGLVSLVITLWLTAGCSALPGVAPTKDTSALNMMPNLAGYVKTNSANLKDTITTLAGGASLLAGQPELSALAALGDRIGTCYNNAGAYEAFVYNQTADLTKMGAILIINNNVVKDINVLLSCLNPRVSSASIATVDQPCTKSYQLATAGNTYEIMYAATSQLVCQDFCNALQECLTH